MRADGVVHQWLGKSWLVTFIMAKTPIAEHVNDRIGAKCLPKFCRNTRHMNDSFRIITIHMKDRYHDHFGDIGRIG